MNKLKCLPNIFRVPMVLVFKVLMGLYMYFTGEAGDARWYISSTVKTLKLRTCTCKHLNFACISVHFKMVCTYI